MARRLLIGRLLAGLGIGLLLLFAVWRLAPTGDEPPGRPAAAAEPPPVALPPELPGRLAELLARFRPAGIVVHHAGPARLLAPAEACFDLVLVVGPEAQPVLRYGRRWSEAPGGGSGELHLAWAGEATPRLRACLVRLLEVLAARAGLPRERIRLHGELPWAKGCSGPAGPACLRQPLSGPALRSWLRVPGQAAPRAAQSGPGQAGSGR